MAKIILCAFLLLNIGVFAGSDFNQVQGEQSNSDQFYVSPFNFNIFEYSEPVPHSNPARSRISKTKMVVRFAQEANETCDIKAKYKEIYIDSSLQSAFKNLKQKAYNQNVYVLVTADFKEIKLNKTNEWFIEKSKFHKVFNVSNISLPLPETTQYYANQILPIRNRNCFTLNCFNKKISGYKISKNKYLANELSSEWIQKLEGMSKLDNQTLVSVSSYANNNEYCKDAPAFMIFMENQNIEAANLSTSVELPQYPIDTPSPTVYDSLIPAGYPMPNELSYGSIQID